jgi:hypothetical protein
VAAAAWRERGEGGEGWQAPRPPWSGYPAPASAPGRPLPPHARPAPLALWSVHRRRSPIMKSRGSDPITSARKRGEEEGEPEARRRSGSGSGSGSGRGRGRGRGSGGDGGGGGRYARTSVVGEVPELDQAVVATRRNQQRPLPRPRLRHLRTPPTHPLITLWLARLRGCEVCLRGGGRVQARRPVPRS